MDFSTLKGLTIPEGQVKQIADASGNVLWSAEKMVKVAITVVCGSIMGGRAAINVSSDKPFAPDPADQSFVTDRYSYVCGFAEDCTIELLAGSIIECEVYDTKQSNRCYVMLNGVKVLSEPGTYVYTVTRDVSIHVEDVYAQGEYGFIIITE